MTKLKSFSRTHPLTVLVTIVAIVGLAGVAWAAASIMRVEPVTVNWKVPDAPRLTGDGPNQTVYRIDPSRSTVSYEVQEQLAGTNHTATGTTKGIAGDVLVDSATPANSKIGDIVVNVEQLTSDQSIRDERIRHEWLQSADYPEARFHTTSITGLPAQIADATDVKVSVVGDLTVKTTTKPVTLDATVRREGDQLHIQASTTVKMADFGVGPMSIIGLVSTGDDAALRFDLLAPNAANVHVVQGDAVAAGAGTTSKPNAAGPSFSKTVQPILENSCASCHNVGGAGENEWKLDTAADAAKAASGLGLVTQTRYMPPWLASDKGVPLQHSPKLSDDEVKAIVDWSNAGGPLDVDPATKIKPTPPPPDVRVPRHDTVLQIPEPYQGSVDKQNDYRCFVLDPHLTAPTVVTGYEFLPQQTKFVHHSLVYRLHADKMNDIQATDDADPGPGWECFGGINVKNTGVSPSGGGAGSDLVAGWAPGQPPSPFPSGTGLLLQPGDVFVMQLHYHVTSPPPPDQSALALEYAKDDPGNYKQITVNTFLAPAEIPCLPGVDAPLCDRKAELDHLKEEYGPVGPSIADGLNLLCRTRPEDLGKLDNGVARSSCDHKLRSDAEALAVLGHMHEIGKTFRMTLNPGTPTEQVLLDIPRWDFDWQFNYELQTPVQLHAGDVIRVECSWDRALVEPGEEPHYITWAEGTEDEMCFSTMAVVKSDGSQPLTTDEPVPRKPRQRTNPSGEPAALPPDEKGRTQPRASG